MLTPMQSRVILHAVSTSGQGKSYVLLDTGRVYIEPKQEPNAPPLPEVEGPIGHFDVKVIGGSGPDVLVQLSTKNGVCRTELHGDIIVCKDKFSDLDSGEEVPAPVVFRAKYHETRGTTEGGISTILSGWSLLGGHPHWSINMAGTGGPLATAGISPKPGFDVSVNVILVELLEI